MDAIYRVVHPAGRFAAQNELTLMIITDQDRSCHSERSEE